MIKIRSVLFPQTILFFIVILWNNVLSQNYSSDSIVVRHILDTNGLYSTQVNIGIIDTSHGRIVKINLPNRNISVIPSIIGQLDSLKDLRLENNNLDSLPIELSNLNALAYLSLSSNKFNTIPGCIFNLNELVYLEMQINQLTEIPQSISNLYNLGCLDLYSNNISTVPAGICSCGVLWNINLSDNLIVRLPDCISNFGLINPITFIIGNNKLCDSISSELLNWLDNNAQSSVLSSPGTWKETQECGNAIEFIKENISEVVVCPNPFSTSFRLKTTVVKVEEISVYNISGKKVLLYKTSRMGGVDFNTRGWLPGIYILKLNHDVSTKQYKLIKF